jgi:hypothetical protein
MLGKRMPVLDTDQRGPERRIDHTGQPHLFVVLEPCSRSRCLGAGAQLPRRRDIPMFSWRRGGTRGACTPAAVMARGPSSGYWLIVKNDNDPLEVRTVDDLNGQKTMPVFSFREEAEMYMRFEVRGSWWVRKASAGELACLLFGFYSCVEKVALDPLPEICHEGMTPLVSVSRKDFMRTLAQKLLSDRGIRISSPPARRPIDLRARRGGGNHHSMLGRELRWG